MNEHNAQDKIVTPSPDGSAAGSPSSPAAGSNHYGLKAYIPEQGLVILYRAGEPSACPACKKRNWNVGRITAECANCTFAIDLEQANR